MAITGLNKYNSLIAQLGLLSTSSDSSSSTSTSGLTSMIGTALLNTSSSTSSASSLGLSTNISTSASLLSTLSKLQKKDPEEFKKVAAEISEQLKDLAADSSSTTSKYTLTKLAGLFSNAGLTGSLSSYESTKSGNLRAYSKKRVNLLAATLTAENQNSGLASSINDIIKSALS